MAIDSHTGLAYNLSLRPARERTLTAYVIRGSQPPYVVTASPDFEDLLIDLVAVQTFIHLLQPGDTIHWISSPAPGLGAECLACGAPAGQPCPPTCSCAIAQADIDPVAVPPYVVSTAGWTQMAAVDRYADHYCITRDHAVRQLIENGLSHWPYRLPTSQELS